jgi:hypothetical protein
MFQILNKIFGILKGNKWLITVIIAVLLVALGLYFGAKVWRAEVKRMENNYLAALGEIKQLDAEHARAYVLEIGELKRQFPEIKQQLQDLDIKLKNVMQVQEINSVTHTTVNTVLRDSVINDTVTARIANYRDKWTDFKLVNIGDSIRSTITTRDSMFIALSKVRRNLWQWLRAEPREVQSTVKNYNPNSKITWNRIIMIK